MCSCQANWIPIRLCIHTRFAAWNHLSPIALKRDPNEAEKRIQCVCWVGICSRSSMVIAGSLLQKNCRLDHLQWQCIPSLRSFLIYDNQAILLVISFWVPSYCNSFPLKFCPSVLDLCNSSCFLLNMAEGNHTKVQNTCLDFQRGQQCAWEKVVLRFVVPQNFFRSTQKNLLIGVTWDSFLVVSLIRPTTGIKKVQMRFVLSQKWGFWGKPWWLGSQKLCTHSTDIAACLWSLARETSCLLTPNCPGALFIVLKRIILRGWKSASLSKRSAQIWWKQTR